MSRECPEPRKDTRSNRGGFNSGTGGDRQTGFRSAATDGGNTFRNMRNQNDNDRGDSNESKPTFTGWRGNAGSAPNNNNDGDDAGKRSAFGSSTTRGGFTNSSGGFRGNADSF
jgi:hypothetical protein